MLPTCFYDETCTSKPVREVLGVHEGDGFPAELAQQPRKPSASSGGSCMLKSHASVCWWWAPETRVANFFVFPALSVKTFAPQQITLTFPPRRYLCCGLSVVDDDPRAARLSFNAAFVGGSGRLGIFCTIITVTALPGEGRCEISHITHASPQVGDISNVSCAAVASPTTPYCASVVYSNGSSVWQVSLREDSDSIFVMPWYEVTTPRKGWSPFGPASSAAIETTGGIQGLAVNDSVSVVFAFFGSNALWAIHRGMSDDIGSLSVCDKGEEIIQVAALPKDLWAIVVSNSERATTAVKVLLYDTTERTFAVQFTVNSPLMDKTVLQTLSVCSVTRAAPSLHLLWQVKSGLQQFTKAGCALLPYDAASAPNEYCIHAIYDSDDTARVLSVASLDVVEAVTGIDDLCILCKSTTTGRKVELSVVPTQLNNPISCFDFCRSSSVHRFSRCETIVGGSCPNIREVAQMGSSVHELFLFNDQVFHAVKQSIAIIEAIPEGFALCQALVHSIISDPSKAATAYEFCVIEAKARSIFADNFHHSVSPEEMNLCLSTALSTKHPVGLNFFASQSRRYIYNVVCQEFLSRIFFMVICYAGFVCSGRHNAIDPVLESAGFAFQLLAAGYSTAVALGPNIVMLAEAADNIPQRCIAALLRVRHETLNTSIVDIVTIAASLSKISSDTARRGLRSWTSAWVQRFPLVRHFDVWCACQRVKGSSSALVIAWHSSVCAAISQLPNSVVAEVFPMIADGFPGDDEELQADIASLVKDGHSVSVYRLGLLRRFVRRVDVTTTESSVDECVIVPLFTGELEHIMNLLQFFEFEFSSVKQFLQALLIDVKVFLLRGSCSRGECTESLSLVADILQLSGPLESEGAKKTSQHYVSVLVKEMIAAGEGMRLADCVITNPAVVSAVATELLSHVRDPRTRAEREAKRVSNALVLYNFWLRRSAFAQAPRITFDVAAAMRTTAKPTSETMKRALKLASLAVGAIEMIPQPASPRHDFLDEDSGMENPFTSGVGGLSSEASVWFASHQAPAEDPISQGDRDAVHRRHIQLYCETKLMKLGTVSDATAPEAVRDELLRVRLWRDALRLSDAYNMDPSVVLQWLVWDLLHLGTEDGWRDAINEIVKRSTPHNNYKYLKECVLLGLQNETFRRVPQTLIAELQKVDPSALLSIYLSRWEKRLPTSPEPGSPIQRRFNRRFIEGVLDSACAALKGRGFEQISETVLERVTAVAESIVTETQASPDAKLVYLSQKFLALVKKHRTLSLPGHTAGN